MTREQSMALKDGDHVRHGGVVSTVRDIHEQGYFLRFSNGDLLPFSHDDHDYVELLPPCPVCAERAKATNRTLYLVTHATRGLLSLSHVNMAVAIGNAPVDQFMMKRLLHASRTCTTPPEGFHLQTREVLL